jgi:uncharacterized protein
MVARLIRALPGWAELAVVIASAFGVSIAISLMVFALGLGLAVSFTSKDLFATVTTELLTLAVLAWFLRLRGWRLNSLGFHRVNWRDLRDAVVLFVAIYALTSGVMFLASVLVPEMLTHLTSALLLTNALSWSSIIAISIVNPVFEEVFVCAFVVEALKHRGWATAIGTSVAIRMIYHLYQGVLGALSVGVIGLVFAGYYWRYGRLWPVIVVHALLDFLSLAQFGSA